MNRTTTTRKTSSAATTMTSKKLRMRMTERRRISTRTPAAPAENLLVFALALSSVSAAASTATTTDQNNFKTNLRRLVPDDDPSNNSIAFASEGPQPRIFGGWDTVEGRYAYAEVSLISTDGHKCGGALVAPDILLSAAHCQLSESKYIDVVVGKHGVTDDTWENFNVVKELVHPDYNTVNTRFDVMLLKSDQLMQDTRPVRINLDESIPVNGESLTVIGLGYTEEWRLPSSLHETTVTYTRNLDCVNMSDSQGQTLKNDLQLDMLCAGDPGRDSCYGDSGSPLIRPGGSTDTDIVVGIVSWGYECGGELPGVYSRLSHWSIQGWLRETICRESIDPPAYLSCQRSSTGEGTAAPPTSAPMIPQPTPTPITEEQPTLVPVPLPTNSPSSGVLWEAVLGRDDTDNSGDPIEASVPSSSSPSTGTIPSAVSWLLVFLMLITVIDFADTFTVGVATSGPSFSASRSRRQWEKGTKSPPKRSSTSILRRAGVAGSRNSRLSCICINCKWVTTCKAYHLVETKHEQPHMTSDPTFQPRDGSPKVNVNIRTEKSNETSAMWSQMYAEHADETRRAAAEHQGRDSDGSSPRALLGPTKYNFQPMTTIEYDVVACEDFIEDIGCWVRNMPDEIKKVNPHFVPT